MLLLASSTRSSLVATTTPQFISVLEVDEKIPAIVVLYRAFDKSTAMEGVDWVLFQSESDESSPLPEGSIVNITATPLEQKLLLKLLKINQHIVPPDYEVDRHETETAFRLSVVFPIGPLDFAARAKLSHNMGCGVCGQKATSRCSQCQSVSYCSSSKFNVNPLPNVAGLTVLCRLSAHRLVPT